MKRYKSKYNQRVSRKTPKVVRIQPNGIHL